MGLKGIWVFITAFIIAYPATYIVQDIYLKTLSESETCNDYTDIISHYLGKNWGVFLGVIYFLMIIHGILSTLYPWFSTARRTLRPSV
ncbi:Inner membrane transport protein YhjV [Citrobacter koseri]|uniref:Inner membrane transport protein YhjV n=1 Tax=Citrobacter koseri TaxID=545 RepID=A0A2X2WJ16_CITKO|nr:Inner membrane transport protein YhjV [Citrobacter koseri]